MTRSTMLRLLAARRRQDEARRKLNERVRRASKGLAHHQACPVGGLFTGMGADGSGYDCWCGGTAEARAREQEIGLDRSGVAGVTELRIGPAKREVGQ